MLTTYFGVTRSKITEKVRESVVSAVHVNNSELLGKKAMITVVPMAVEVGGETISVQEMDPATTEKNLSTWIEVWIDEAGWWVREVNSQCIQLSSQEGEIERWKEDWHCCVL